MENATEIPDTVRVHLRPRCRRVTGALLGHVSKRHPAPTRASRTPMPR